MVNDIFNNLFPSVINTNYPIRPVGRPTLSNEERLKKNQNQKAR